MRQPDPALGKGYAKIDHLQGRQNYFVRYNPSSTDVPGIIETVLTG